MSICRIGVELYLAEETKLCESSIKLYCQENLDLKTELFAACIAVENKESHSRGSWQFPMSNQPPRRICNFFSTGRKCRFGRNCRFLHKISSNLQPPLDYQDDPLGTSIEIEQEAYILVHREGSISSSNQTNSVQVRDTSVPSHKQEPNVQQNCSFHDALPKVCHSFMQYGNCRFGSRCKFRHVLPSVKDLRLNAKQDDTRLHASGHQKSPNIPPRLLANRSALPDETHQGPQPFDTWCSRRQERFPPATSRKVANPEQRNADTIEEKNGNASGEKIEKRSQSKKICRYFKAGNCTMGKRCRFWHPEELPGAGQISRNDLLHPTGNDGREQKSKPVVAPRDTKIILESLTPEECDRLREVEISLIKKRFPKVKDVSSAEDEATVLQLNFIPSDPDWVSDPDRYNKTNW